LLKNSFLDCIGVARGGDFDAFVGVGGGSAIDTCKGKHLKLEERKKKKFFFLFSCQFIFLLS